MSGGIHFTECEEILFSSVVDDDVVTGKFILVSRFLGDVSF